MAAIFPPLIVTLTRIVPPNPVPLPSYVPSLYPSAGTLATGVCVVPCPAAPALLFTDSETVLVPELFFAAVFLLQKNHLLQRNRKIRTVPKNIWTVNIQLRQRASMET